MILCDTGPIVALLNRNDPFHVSCTKIAETTTDSFLTTQACLTEAMYLLRRDTGYQGIGFLWNFIESGLLMVAEAKATSLPRIHLLMDRYKDLPCDYADATLIALAEDTGLRSIFTIDSHFHAYRLQNGETLLVTT